MASAASKLFASDIEPEYRVFVAIDLGTTYSACALAIGKDSGEIVDVSKKIPTALLLDTSTRLIAFGDAAIEEFYNLDEDVTDDYYYFDRFKMTLHNDAVRHVLFLLFFLRKHAEFFRQRSLRSCLRQRIVQALPGPLEQRRQASVLFYTVPIAVSHEFGSELHCSDQSHPLSPAELPSTRTSFVFRRQTFMIIFCLVLSIHFPTFYSGSNSNDGR